MPGLKAVDSPSQHRIGLQFAKPATRLLSSCVALGGSPEPPPRARRTALPSRPSRQEPLNPSMVSSVLQHENKQGPHRCIMH